MWNWISEKVRRAFDYVRRAFNKVGESVLDTIRAGPEKAETYCRDSRLRKFVVGFALFCATSMILLFMSEVVLVAVSIVGGLWAASTLLDTVQACINASGPIDMLFELVTGVGKSILVLLAAQLMPFVTLSFSCVLMASAFYSWLVDGRAREQEMAIAA